ncbi:MAG: peptidylprolyl isomerase [Bacteroidota bacterium]
MKINKDQMVSLSYDLFENDFNGKLIESFNENYPFTFLFDSGKLLKNIENKLKGLKENDKFEYILDSSEAYGNYDDNKIMNLPLVAFEINGKVDKDVVAPGKNVPMQDKHGNKLFGKIIEITDNEVKMDFNHPFAGKSLAFRGKVIVVRNATEQELNAHIHGHDASQCKSCNKTCN